MKEKELDNLIKTKVENLDNLLDLKFEEDKVWRNVSKKIPKSTNSQLYYFVSISVLIFMGIIYFFLSSQNRLIEEKEIVVPIETKEKLLIDSAVNIKKDVIKKTSIIHKKNSLKKKKKETENIKRIVTDDTLNVIDSNKTNELLKGLNQDRLHKIDFTKNTETRAYIHIYRPSKGIVGVLNYFTIKANGKKIGTISNGEYKVFRIEPRLTEFEVKGKKIKINLEPRKNYYLRTELIFLGKTKFEWVTESFAKKEFNFKQE